MTLPGTTSGDETREQLAALPTASISDALDFLRLPGSLHSIGPLRDGPRVVGQAFTVQYEPVDPDRPGTVGDFLDDVAAGAVVVIDNAGRTDCTVWGGIMTRIAAARGIAGTVIHGTCRDVPSILEVGYPMWSNARFMRTGKDRVQLQAVQVPLQIDGVPIRPGDWMCADDDGALVVPADRASEVIEVAQRIERTESAITSAVLAGASLIDARKDHGYHALQTPPAGSTKDIPPTTQIAVGTARHEPNDAYQARGHSSTTLYEAAHKIVTRQPIALDSRIQAAWTGARLCGPAFTVQGCGGDNLALHHAVVTAPAGSILVVDVGGARHGHWGEVLAVAAQQRGIAGLLIDGGVRDRKEQRDLGFPVFSRRNSIVGTRKDFRGTIGAPVTVGGVVVATGDLLVGDADGVVAIPAADISRVLDAADARVAHERDIVSQLRRGATTIDLYRLPTR